MLISNRKVSIPFVADAKMPIFWPGSKKLWFFTPNMRFHWEKLKGWSDKVEIFVTYRSKYLQKNDQNSVFVREALHGEIIFWNNQIFEEGYLSHPKYLGSTVWFNIQLVPKSKICYIVLQILLNLIMAMIVHDFCGQIYNESDQIFSSNICHLK